MLIYWRRLLGLATRAEDWDALAIGFTVSLVVAFITVKWLLRYVQSHRFTVFAWYRIILGTAFLAAIGTGVMG